MRESGSAERRSEESEDGELEGDHRGRTRGEGRKGEVRESVDGSVKGREREQTNGAAQEAAKEWSGDTSRGQSVDSGWPKGSCSTSFIQWKAVEGAIVVYVITGLLDEAASLVLWLEGAQEWKSAVTKQ